MWLKCPETQHFLQQKRVACCTAINIAIGQCLLPPLNRANGSLNAPGKAAPCFCFVSLFFVLG